MDETANKTGPRYNWQLGADGKPRQFNRKAPSYSSRGLKGQTDNTTGIQPYASKDPTGPYARQQWRVSHPLEHAIEVLENALNGIPMIFPNGEYPAIQYKDDIEIAARLEQYKEALARRNRLENIPHERTKPSFYEQSRSHIAMSRGPWS